MVALVPAITGALLAGATPVIAVPDTAIPERYTEQSIDWHTCADDELPSPPPPGAEQLRCGVFTVPMDWNNPDEGSDLTIAVSKLSGTGAVEGSLVTNPGGPGGPGRAFPLRLRKQSKVREAYDVIGFDPRGTGMSDNITCGDTISALDPLDPRDRGADNIDLILDTTETAADACQRKSGELGPLVNTFQTVRDIDLLRALLGRDKISWVGYSAGTWMGAHYATAFPSRVDKFVLDSNVEFTTNWQDSFDWQPLGFERRWRADFLPWIARYDSVYHYGRSSLRARLTYERVRAKLQEEPVNLDGATIGPNEFDIQIVGSMYNKKAFVGLAEYLVAVRELAEERVRGAERQQALATLRALRIEAIGTGPRPLVVPLGYDDAYSASFWSIPCNETAWTGDRRSVVADSESLGRRYPLLGWGWFIQPCVFWDNQPIQLPMPTGAGVPPVLMVQSTHDAATPFEGALRAHRNFAGSRMLTVVKEGDHGIYAGGNTCVDEIVEDYLVDNVVPIQDTTCEGTPLPTPSSSRAYPPEGTSVSGTA